MTDIGNHIDFLQEKLQSLIREYKQLQKENSKLLKEIAVLQSEKEEKSRQYSQMEEKLAALQLTAGNWDETERANLQKKIDTYLKEIDQCLALLHA